MFIFLCFYLFMFSFLHVFISTDVFGCTHRWLHLFTSLFLHCFSGTSFLHCCTASATDLRERVLLQGVFYLTLFPAFIKASLGLVVLPWRFQVFPLRFKIQNRSISLFEPSSVRHYMISKELYLNLSKYVEKFLVWKSLINFKAKNVTIDRLLVSLTVFQRDFTNVILVHVILWTLFY